MNNSKDDASKQDIKEQVQTSEAQAPEKLSVKEIFKQAWQVFKANWKVIFLTGAIYLGVQFLEGMISGFIQVPALSFMFQVGTMILDLLMSVGFTKVFINLVRGEEVSPVMLFNQAHLLWRYFLASLLVGLVVIAGLLLFIVPGIYFALKYAFVLYLVVDRSLTAREALRLSAQMTDKIKWRLLWFNIVAGLFNLAGVLALGLGWIITVPVTYLAFAYLYNILLARVDV